MALQTCQDNPDLLAHSWGGVFRRCESCGILVAPEVIDAAVHDAKLYERGIDDAIGLLESVPSAGSDVYISELQKLKRRRMGAR